MISNGFNNLLAGVFNKVLYSTFLHALNDNVLNDVFNTVRLITHLTMD